MRRFDVCECVLSGEEGAKIGCEACEGSGMVEINCRDRIYQLDEQLGNRPLAARLERRERRRGGSPPQLLVFVTLTERCYGGPEEGGWWYDRSWLEAMHVATDWKDALRAVRRFKQEFPPPRHPRWSVIGGADVEVGVVSHRDFLPRERGQVRPQYE